MLLSTAAMTAPGEMADFSVVDGDTLQIGDKVFDLFGLDAPELGQLCYHDDRWNRCGVAAAFELKKLLAFDKPLLCEPAPEHRSQLVCHAAGSDVALVLLRAGYAVAASGSGVAYREAEKSAREGNLGLWHMAFVSPWDWRFGRRLSPAESEEELSCPIKAIVDPDGRKLYYVPTDDNYKKVVVDPSKGDRLFCSDAATRKAGWRRPGEA